MLVVQPNRVSEARGSSMTTARLEAFSDGVFAIIITIMVLALPRPQGTDWAGLLRVWPAFLSYLLSFVFVGLAWRNHQHLFRRVQRVSDGVMWANLHLLFWLSVLPFVTAWAGETHFAPVPMTVYAADALLSAVAFNVLSHVIGHHPDNHPQGLDNRGSLAAASLLAHVVAVLAPIISPAGVWVTGVCFLFVTLSWLVPERRNR